MKEKFIEHWQQETLETLEKNIWPTVNPDETSYLIFTCNSLRRKQLKLFSIEDLRIMIGQEIGFLYLIPLAIEHLSIDLFAEGDFYKGDLLNSVLNIDESYWIDNKDEWQKLNELIKNRKTEIKQLGIKIDEFENAIY
jgi:CDI immunity proteins